MFGNKGRKEPAITTLVGSETRIHGDIEFTGGCLVDGYVRGNVKSVGDETATLSVSANGRIEGTVDVPHVLLNGTVTGDVRAAERVELGSKAEVTGNVQYKLIEMAIGAEVNGKLIHESEGRNRLASAENTDAILAESERSETTSEYEPRPRMTVLGD